LAIIAHRHILYGDILLANRPVALQGLRKRRKRPHGVAREGARRGFRRPSPLAPCPGSSPSPFILSEPGLASGPPPSGKSGASRSSSPAIPTRVNRA
jgi:hypothetical protein